MAIYLRRSKDDAEGSLPVQDASCRAYAAAQGWVIVAVETDMESAYRDGNEGRAGYQRVIELARTGAIDHLVVWKWSRFGRDAGEALSRLKELGRLGVALHSPTEDLDNPLLAGILAVIAENESRELSARVTPAKRRLAALGQFQGSIPPFGTVRTAGGQLAPGPDFALVREMFERTVAGEGVTAIARSLSARTGRDINIPQVIRVLRNPAYIGRLRGLLPGGARGETDAAWQAMLPPGLWEAAQTVRGRDYRARHRRGTATGYWIAGLVTCGVCGGRCGVWESARRRTRAGEVRHIYLRCHHNCRAVADDPVALQQWVRAEMGRAVFAPATHADLRAAIAAAANRQVDTHALRRQELTGQRAEAMSRRGRAEQGYLDGLFSAERALVLKGDTDSRIAALDRELATLPPPPAVDIDRWVRLLASPDWHGLADTDPAAYGAILAEVIEHIAIGPRPRRGQPPPREITYRPLVAELFS